MSQRGHAGSSGLLQGLDTVPAGACALQSGHVHIAWLVCAYCKVGICILQGGQVQQWELQLTNAVVRVLILYTNALVHALIVCLVGAPSKPAKQHSCIIWN